MSFAARWRPDLIGFWDADLSTPLDELDGFLAVLDERPGIEMVFGARVGLMGRSIQRSLGRHYIARVLATLISSALRLPIYDTQCGAKVFRASSDLDAVLEEPFLSRWLFDVEIIARFARLREGMARPRVEDIIYELPLQHWREVGGSKIRLFDALTIGLELLRVYFRYLRGR
jgi:hypothetical protein